MRLEHQGVLGLEAVVDRLGPRVEVAHQVEHAIADAGGVDADVLYVEPLGEFLDLVGLVLERLAPPAVFLQDPELGALLERRGDDHARCIVTGAAGVVADPDRAVAEGSIVVGVVVCPQGLIAVAALKVGQVEGPLRAVDEFAHEQLLKRIVVVLQLQLLEVEQIASAVDRVQDGDRLAPLAVRA
ncbi:hypothetical protein D3C77_235420 [compost metagenome]